VGLSNRRTGSNQKFKYRKICLKDKKAPCDVGGQTLAQVAWRCWGVSNLGDLKKPD